MPGPYTRGARSAGQLATCHYDLEIIAVDLLEVFDHSVHQGGRTVEEQIRNILNGASKTIDSRHIPRDAEGNYDPRAKCIAFDLLPYTKGVNPWPQAQDPRAVQTKKANRFYFMQGCVLTIAQRHGIAIRQGVDWNLDGDFFDQTFDDLPHVELLRTDFPRLRLPDDLLGFANDALRERGLPEYKNP